MKIRVAEERQMRQTFQFSPTICVGSVGAKEKRTKISQVLLWREKAQMHMLNNLKRKRENTKTKPKYRNLKNIPEHYLQKETDDVDILQFEKNPIESKTCVHLL